MWPRAQRCGCRMYAQANHFYALVISSVRYLFSLEIYFTLYAMLYTPGYLWGTFHSDHAGLKPLPSLLALAPFWLMYHQNAHPLTYFRGVPSRTRLKRVIFIEVNLRGGFLSLNPDLLSRCGLDIRPIRLSYNQIKLEIRANEARTENVVKSVARCALCNSTPSCLIWLVDSQIVFYCFSQLISQRMATSKYGDFATCNPNIEFDRFKFGQHIKFEIVEPVSFCEVSRLIWAYCTPNCHFLSFSSSNRPTRSNSKDPSGGRLSQPSVSAGRQIIKS